jgi:hypothetical protein
MQWQADTDAGEPISFSDSYEQHAGACDHHAGQHDCAYLLLRDCLRPRYRASGKPFAISRAMTHG